MNAIAKSAARNTGIRKGKWLFWFVCLLLLGIFAGVEFWNSGLVRRTFVYYSLWDGTTVVEDRMLPLASSEEIEIRRYVEEVLLGPVSPNTAPLFFRDTRLHSLLYREGVVYVDLSESAVLSPVEGSPLQGENTFLSLYTLDEEIRRNFSGVTDVRLFIEGHLMNK